jgi:hypothetical protein
MINSQKYILHFQYSCNNYFENFIYRQFLHFFLSISCHFYILFFKRSFLSYHQNLFLMYFLRVFLIAVICLQKKLICQLHILNSALYRTGMRREFLHTGWLCKGRGRTGSTPKDNNPSVAIFRSFSMPVVSSSFYPLCFSLPPTFWGIF